MGQREGEREREIVLIIIYDTMCSEIGTAFI